MNPAAAQWFSNLRLKPFVKRVQTLPGETGRARRARTAIRSSRQRLLQRDASSRSNDYTLREHLKRSLRMWADDSEWRTVKRMLTI
jgi:hypothetical protein